MSYSLPLKLEQVVRIKDKNGIMKVYNVCKAESDWWDYMTDLHTHINEEKVGVHIFGKKKKKRKDLLHAMCVYIPVCLSKQLDIAISRTTRFLY